MMTTGEAPSGLQAPSGHPEVPPAPMPRWADIVDNGVPQYVVEPRMGPTHERPSRLAEQFLRDQGINVAFVPRWAGQLGELPVAIFRATEDWRDAESMWNGETSMNRFAILKAARTYVVQDPGKKPQVIMLQVHSSVIKGNGPKTIAIIETPVEQAPPRVAIPGLEEHDKLIQHVLVPHRELHEVRCDDPRVQQQIDTLLRIQANDKARGRMKFPQRKWYVTAPRPIYTCVGATITPLEYLIATSSAHRMTVKLSKHQQAQPVIEAVWKHKGVGGIHHQGNMLRLLMQNKVSVDDCNALKGLAGVDNVFSDVRPDGLAGSDGVSSEGRSDGGKKYPPRVAITDVNGGCMQESEVKAICDYYHLRPAKSTASSLVWFLADQTAQTPVLPEFTRVGSRWLVRVLPPKAMETTADF